MKLGSLFSGGGLGDFGFMAASMEIAWQCEIDEYCQKILALRYPESKKYRDIKTLKGADLEPVDIITGGFPCQPFSVAGKQKGKDDNRYLWPEMLRIIKECRPRWIVGENAPGIINMALDDVCADLESEGYEVRPIVFPSHALGAWHRRDRIWIIAHTAGIEQPSQKEDVANAEIPGLQGRKNGRDIESKFSRLGEGCRAIQEYWQSEPDVGRVVNGCPSRVDRLKMLGNGQVPACTYVIGKMIMDIENALLMKGSHHGT